MRGDKEEPLSHASPFTKTIGTGEGASPDVEDTFGGEPTYYTQP